MARRSAEVTFRPAASAACQAAEADQGAGKARTSGLPGAEPPCAIDADLPDTLDRVVNARSTYNTMARTASQTIHMSAALQIRYLCRNASIHA